jgi:Rad3-related DNA helicase
LARGFYDRLPAARAEAVDTGWLDPAAQRAIALRHGICPYYLGHELLRWVDVVVGDVHHAFDPNGQLFGLAQALDWRIGLLVDEAHNLIERARQMYSASMGLAQIRAAASAAPTGLRAPFVRFLNAAREAAATQDGDYAAYEAVPAALSESLQALNAAVGQYLQDQPASREVSGPLLNFYFEAFRLQRLIDRFGPHSVFDIQRSTDIGAAAAGRPALADQPRQVPLDTFETAPTPAPGDTESANAESADATLSIRNVVPGAFLRPRFAGCHTVTLFSATLGPDSYQRDLLGLPENCAWIDVPPAFPPENLSVHIADRVSTRFPHRQGSLDAVIDVVARQFAVQPGNYLAFFSSFDYLEQAATRLATRAPSLPQWRQARSMDEASRREFLQRFAADGRGVGFAVLGGAFAEGIDLPGTRLIGAFIATLGLPPLSPVQDQFRLRLDAVFAPGHGYADLVPGLQKVVQAAGRVIRSPDDRGWLWLMDDRYRRPQVMALLPAWWRIAAAVQAAPADAKRAPVGAAAGML